MVHFTTNRMDFKPIGRTGGAGNGGFGSGVTPSVSPSVNPFGDGGTEEIDGETHDPSNPSQSGS